MSRCFKDLWMLVVASLFIGVWLGVSGTGTGQQSQNDTNMYNVDWSDLIDMELSDWDNEANCPYVNGQQPEGQQTSQPQHQTQQAPADIQQPHQGHQQEGPGEMIRCLWAHKRTSSLGMATYGQGSCLARFDQLLNMQGCKHWTRLQLRQKVHMPK